MKFLLFEDGIPKKAGSGGHVATFGLINFLRERGDLHIVNVLSNADIDPLEGPDVTLISRDETRVHGFGARVRSLVSSAPKFVTEIDWDGLMQAVAPHLPADRIILGSARFLRLAEHPEIGKACYYIGDNVEWELVLAMESNYRSPFLARLDAGRIRALEARGIAQVCKAAAFTKRDAHALARLAVRDVEVIPPILAPAGRAPKPRENFVFYPTNLQHPPNVDAMNWLLKEVWPARKSDWNLVVTGAGDFKAYAEANAAIDFRGFVSREELADLYDRAGVVINPTRTGSGFQIKLLEALSYGCRVVSTEFSNPLGPIIRSSDDPIEFSRLVELTVGDADAPSFNYEEFYRKTVERLERFLEIDGKDCDFPL